MGESWEAEKTGIRNARDLILLFLQFDPADIPDKLACGFYEKEMGSWWNSREDGSNKLHSGCFLFGITPVTFDFPKFGVESPSFPQLLKTWGCFVFGLSG